MWGDKRTVNRHNRNQTQHHHHHHQHPKHNKQPHPSLPIQYYPIYYILQILFPTYAAFDAAASTTASRTIFPSFPLGFRCHPVLNSFPIWKRGNACASVLITILSSGHTSLGPKRR